MLGVFDAACPKCGGKVSWAGEYTERPPCRDCGHKVAELDAADAERHMLDVSQLLALRTHWGEFFDDRRLLDTEVADLIYICTRLDEAESLDALNEISARLKREIGDYSKGAQEGLRKLYAACRRAHKLLQALPLGYDAEAPLPLWGGYQ